MFGSALLRLQWFVRIRTPEAAASSGPGTKGVCRVLCFAQLPLQRTEKLYPDSCWPPSLAPLPPPPRRRDPPFSPSAATFPVTATPTCQRPHPHRPHPPPATPAAGHTRQRPFLTSRRGVGAHAAFPSPARRRPRGPSVPTEASVVTWAGSAQSSSLRLPPGAPSLWGGPPPPGLRVAALSIRFPLSGTFLGSSQPQPTAPFPLRP